MPFLRANQVVLFFPEGQTGRDIIGEQAGCPFGATNRLPFLRDKQAGLIGGKQSALFRDKKVALFEGQTDWSY